MLEFLLLQFDDNLPHEIRHNYSEIALSPVESTVNLRFVYVRFGYREYQSDLSKHRNHSVSVGQNIALREIHRKNNSTAKWWICERLPHIVITAFYK